MKILQVHNYYKYHGGEDRVFKSEGIILRNRGNEVIEYTVSNRSIREKVSLSLGVKAVWSEKTRLGFMKLLKFNRPDVVHFHNIFPLISPSAYYACRQFKIPVIQTLHNYRLLCPGAFFFRNDSVCEECIGKALAFPAIKYSCYRDSYFQTAAVVGMVAIHKLIGTWKNKISFYIALTEFARNKYIKGGLLAEKIVVKPNFVSNDFKSTKQVKKYFLFVGRLSPEKGLRTLIKAWKGVEGMNLKIAGEGPLEEEIKTFIEENKIKNIELLGSCPNDGIIELMKMAYCLILPSEWYECFSVTIIEAFACGIPVIASPLGAMAELIEDGLTGIFFKTGDSDDLRKKIEWSLLNLDYLDQMGKNARLEYEIKYTSDKNYSLLINIYNRAIDKNKFKSN